MKSKMIRLLVFLSFLVMANYGEAVSKEIDLKLMRTLGAHSDKVSCVAFLPDGKKLVSGGEDRTLRIWDAQTGSLLRTMNSSTVIMAIACSADGNLIASGNFDKTIKIWDVRAGLLLRTLKGHSGSVLSVAFSADGKKLLSGGWDNTVRVWDVESGQLLNTLTAHSGRVSAVAFSPNGKRIISGSWDNTLKVWNAETGLVLHTLDAHSKPISAVVYLPDGQKVVSGSWDNTLRIWNAETGLELQAMQGHSGPVLSVVYSTVSKQIISGGWDKTLKVWDTRSGRLLSSFNGHLERINGVACSPNGERLVSGSDDKTVRIWDAMDKKLLSTSQGHAKNVNAVRYSPDGRFLISASDDNTIKIWKAATGQLLKSLRGHSASVLSAVYSPDGKFIASGSDDNTIKVWEASTGELLLTLRGHAGRVTSVAYSPDGKFIASASYDGTVKIWDAESGFLSRTLTGHFVAVSAVVYSPDGELIASASWDKTIRVWGAASGQNLRTLRSHSAPIFSIAFSPDSKQIASGSDDYTAKIWTVQTGRLVRTLRRHNAPVVAVKFSPDGTQLLSGGDDRFINIWETKTGRLVKQLYDHTDRVTAVDYSPNGKFIVSGSWDKTLKTWKFLGLEAFIEREINSMLAQKIEDEEKKLEAWKQKGEFEKTADYSKRLKTWPQRLREFKAAIQKHKENATNFVMQKFMLEYAHTLSWHNYTIASYDADNEVFKLNIPEIGDFVLSVPIDKAKAFKTTGRIYFRTPNFTLTENGWKLSTVDVVHTLLGAFKYDVSMEKGYEPPKPLMLTLETPTIRIGSIQLAQKSSEETAEEIYNVDFNLPETRMENPDAIAVVIGNRDYEKTQGVDYAINDARAIKRYLKDVLGYRDGNIFFKENASLADFASFFGNERSPQGQLYNAVKPGVSDVFVFYAGHGAPGFKDGRNYFIPTEADPKSAELSGFPIETFERNLAKVPAKTITVVLDACFSGSNLTEVVSGISGSQVVVRKPLLLKNSVVFGSSSGKQVSTWHDGAKHGIFTYFFLKAIHNRNGDKNKDGKLTIAEIYNYVSDETNGVPYHARRMHRLEQTPTLEAKDADKERVLVVY